MAITQKQVRLLSVSLLIATALIPLRLCSGQAPQVSAESNAPWYSSKAVWALGAAALVAAPYLYKKFKNWYSKPYATTEVSVFVYEENGIRYYQATTTQYDKQGNVLDTTEAIRSEDELNFIEIPR